MQDDRQQPVFSCGSLCLSGFLLCFSSAAAAHAVNRKTNQWYRPFQGPHTVSSYRCFKTFLANEVRDSICALTGVSRAPGPTRPVFTYFHIREYSRFFRKILSKLTVAGLRPGHYGWTKVWFDTPYGKEQEGSAARCPSSSSREAFYRAMGAIGSETQQKRICRLSFVIWGLGRLAQRSGTSPAPNAIRTAWAGGLQRPDDK